MIIARHRTLSFFYTEKQPWPPSPTMPFCAMAAHPLNKPKSRYPSRPACKGRNSEATIRLSKTYGRNTVIFDNANVPISLVPFLLLIVPINQPAACRRSWHLHSRPSPLPPSPPLFTSHFGIRVGPLPSASLAWQCATIIMRKEGRKPIRLFACWQVPMPTPITLPAGQLRANTSSSSPLSGAQ